MKKLLIFTLIAVFGASILFVGVSCKEEAVEQEAVKCEGTTAAEEVEEKEEEATGEVIELKFYNDAVEFDNAYTEIGNISAEEIGIRIVPVSYEADVYRPQVKMGLTEGDIAMAKWWSGSEVNVLVDDGLVIDMSSVWDEVGDQIAPGIREKLTYNGTVWSGLRSNATWAWFYNKRLMNDLGLELPKTWDDLMVQCEYLKDQGISPIGNSPAASWNSFIMPMELSFRLDPAAYDGLLTNKIPWVSDEGRELLTVWGDMIKKGYFVNSDLNYIDDYPGLMTEGKLMYIPLGAWYGKVLTDGGVLPEDLGYYIMPPINPDKASGYVASESSLLIVGAAAPEAEKEIAKKWIAWYMSESGQKAAWDQLKDQPYNVNIPIDWVEADNPAVAEVMNQLADYSNVLERIHELAADPRYSLESWDHYSEFILNPNNIEETLQKLQDSMDKFTSETES